MFTPRGSYVLQRSGRGRAKVYLYQAGYFHPKTLNIDNAVITIGTANMDIRSFSLNHETTAIVYDEGKAKELETQFHEDLKHCQQWTVEQYQSYMATHRFVDSVYPLTSPIL